MSVVSQITGDVNKGVAVIDVLFVVGFILLEKSTQERGKHVEEKEEIGEVIA